MTPSNHDDQNNNQKNTNINDEDRKKEARLVRRIVAIVLTIFIVAFAVIGISTYSYIKNGLKPVDKADTATKEVVIPMGSSVTQIANILEEDGIIRDSRIFRYYIKFKNEAGFQAGEYQFSPSMKFDELIAALKTGKVIKEAVITVTIPEGKTIDQIAEIFSKKTNVTKEQFLDKVNNRDYVKELIEKHPAILSDDILDPNIKYPLEGYLFAATYQFYENNPSIDTIVNDMLTKTEDVVLPYLDGIQEQGLSVHQAVTMASLVENEAREPEDRKLIAGVFYNRLDIDMRLQTDPTVLYALGGHKDRVLNDDLKVESPYNTYVIMGLPIGPISNFGESSIAAAANPEKTDYYYFIAGKDGQIHYAKTLDEHNRLVQKYLR